MLSTKAHYDYEGGIVMPVLTVRGVPDEETRVQMGDALTNLSYGLGLTDGDIAVIGQARDRAATEPMTFE
jgi:hypothetical protein